MRKVMKKAYLFGIHISPKSCSFICLSPPPKKIIKYISEQGRGPAVYDGSALQREERRRIRLGAWARMCLALAPDLEDTRSDGSSDDEEFLATLFAPRCARCGFRVFYPSSPETLPARCPAGHAEFEVYIERKRVQIS